MGDAFNPFNYSTPVGPNQLIDRDDEAEALLELAEGGHYTRLGAPRRYGKTSLLRRVLRDAESIGLNVALIDLYGVVGTADVAVRLRDAYDAFRGPIARRAARLVENASVRLGIGPGQLELSTLGGKPAEAALWELLEIPRQVHERTGQRCLVVWDEFQDLLKAGDGLDAIVRSRIQHQSEIASYVFSGSHEGMLSLLFDRRERPLYGQARHIPLGPLPDVEVADWLGERFERDGREIGPALGYLLRAARGHPQRTVLLAHHLWSATPPGGTADESSWREAELAAFTDLRESLSAAWDGLSSDSDRRFLDAVAGPTPPFAASTLDKVGLTRASATRARARLLRSGDLLEVADGLRLTDPLWERWIAAGRRTPPALSRAEEDES